MVVVVVVIVVVVVVFAVPGNRDHGGETRGRSLMVSMSIVDSRGVICRHRHHCRPQFSPLPCACTIRSSQPIHQSSSNSLVSPDPFNGIQSPTIVWVAIGGTYDCEATRVRPQFPASPPVPSTFQTL